MTRAKRSKKFATMKRMISPNDPRLKEKDRVRISPSFKSYWDFAYSKVP